MNPRTVSIATLTCALVGCWLPSLWLSPPALKARALLPPPAVREPAWQGLQLKVRRAGTAMKQFQAVVAGVRGHGDSLAFLKEGEMDDLGCEAAEELAMRLAGEELAAHVTDGPAFLKSLRECDYYARDAALEAWAAADPDAALAPLISSAGECYGVAEDLIQRLAARDPDKALAMLKDVKTAPAREAQVEVWNAVLAACADKGTDYALAAILSAPRNSQEQGLDALLRVMAAKDPRTALAWCGTLPRELRGVLDQASIYETWGRTDPEAALKEWVGAGNLAIYPTGHAIVRAWAAKDPEAVFKWATAQSEGWEQIINIAAENIVSRNPQRALAMIEYLPRDAPVDASDAFETDGRKKLLWKIGDEWAKQDSAAALTWARSLSGEERSYVINGLRPHLTGMPPEERLALARELGPETSAGFQLLWEADCAAATAAFASLTAEQKLSKFSAIANGTAFESPVIKAGLLESVIRDWPSEEAARSNNSRELSRHVAALTSDWAGRDPAAAAAWVSHLPPGESQATAAANVTLTWGRYDFPAARAWVEKLPAGPARERAGERLSELTASGGE